MKHEKLYILFWWFLAAGLFSMNIRGGWAEKFYLKNKDAYWAWYWLRFFKIDLTERNCTIFIKATSTVGLFLVSAGCFAALWTF